MGYANADRCRVSRFLFVRYCGALMELSEFSEGGGEGGGLLMAMSSERCCVYELVIGLISRATRGID